MGHAKTPWKVVKGVAFYRVQRVKPNTGHIVETRLCGDDDRANAEFIVRACNAHDDLLEACKSAQATIKALCEELGVRETLEQPLSSEHFYSTNEMLEQLDAAIAKASLS